VLLHHLNPVGRMHLEGKKSICSTSFVWTYKILESKPPHSTLIN
jgi:hypothetical protein